MGDIRDQLGCRLDKSESGRRRRIGQKILYAALADGCELGSRRSGVHFATRGELRLAGRACGYSSDRMALSSRKRIAPSLLVSAITKRTRPCLEVSA